jgi:hypothetical protein
VLAGVCCGLLRGPEDRVGIEIERERLRRSTVGQQGRVGRSGWLVTGQEESEREEHHLETVTEVASSPSSGRTRYSAVGRWVVPQIGVGGWG